MKYTVGIITLSDKGSKGLREDKSGPAIREILEADGRFDVLEQFLFSDDRENLERELVRLCDEEKLNLILTTGGTGLSPRDNAPEATLAVADRQVPGIAEYMRARSFEITPKAMLSRGVSVMRGSSLIINLPGSTKAVRENLGFIMPALGHGLDIMLGRDGECGSD
ncbi:MAG: MogA/MoaB family molybdenum cofactor biosynthesis protein [Firmicutes bacterium]|nr:MogA/MoaB family molybdenum cofactor biosynthesis protein [Bacillota bacterium]MDY5770498.1 MogA/MoaB family molybdenum cofactor biosynthesis protein [Anaerovoracaceae bacterium]